MEGTLKAWIQANGRKLAWIGGSLSALQAGIALILAFADNLKALAESLPAVSNIIQAAFLVIAVGYLIGNGYKTEKDSTREQALKWMLACWLTILVCWAILYLLKVLGDFHAPLPTGFLSGWFPNLVGRLPTVPFFVMYLVACNRLSLPSSRLMIASLVSFILILTVIDAGVQQRSLQLQAMVDAQAKAATAPTTTVPASAPASGPADELRSLNRTANRIQLMSCAVDCLVLTMFVSRLDSKILALPPVLIYSLYLYSALQLVFSVADAEMVKSLMAAAFIGKAVLILTLTWLFDTPGMSLFLRKIGELGDAAPSDLNKANDGSNYIIRKIRSL